MALSMIRIVLTPLILCLVLTGCGFQLKGSAGSARNTLLTQPIAIVSAHPRSEFSVAVVQRLRLEGAQIVEPDDDVLLIKLGEEHFQQRNLSLTAQARSAEVELIMRTDFSLFRGRSVVIEHSTANVIRQFLNDPRNVVGKTEELRLLRQEMRDDLAAQIIRHISHSLSR